MRTRQAKPSSGNAARTWSVALALLAVLVLAGCTSGGGAPSTADSLQAHPSRTTITWAFEREFSQYNADTSAGSTDANAVILNGVLSGFWRYAPDGTAQPNTDFGTYRKISDDPLTVRYTIADRAVWSDGVPIDCDDIALAWLANSGATGDHGFDAASTLGYRDMNKPQCQSGDRSFTVVYRTPFADWRYAFGPGSAWIMPAHVVEKQAGLHRTFVDYLAAPHSPDLTRAITFWNTGWVMHPGELRKDLTPSSGPYLLDAWTAGSSLTLRANPRWWGTPPRADAIVVRFIDAPHQAQALQSGQIQAMDPEPQMDIVNQLRAMGSRISLTYGDSYDVEHLDLNQTGVLADRTLREAFALCVPRQQIVDTLVKPVSPAARILESRFVLPFQPEYDRLATTGGRRYDAVDLAGAKRLMAGRTVTLRVGWRKDPDAVNQRRLSTIALIRASCAQAGITIVDAGTPTFFDHAWAAGTWDVALFAWTGTPMVTAGSDIYTTGGGSNRSGYHDADVDRLTTQLATEPDRGRQVALLQRIDTQLWTDLASIPLFALPSVTATSKDVSGIVFNPTVSGLTWNVASWSRG